MAYTYNLSATVRGGKRFIWDSVWDGSSAEDERRAGLTGTSTYHQCSMIFNTSSLAGKTITGINLTFTVVSGTIPGNGTNNFPICYKADSSTTSWKRSSTSAVGYIKNQTSGGGSYGASNTQMTVNMGTTLPSYGYVAGSIKSPSGSYKNVVLGSSATLAVTTNENQYNYTLAYNANGGSGAPANQTGTNVQVTASYKFTVSATIPTRTGYTFLGWSTSSTATSASYAGGSQITVSNGTTTLYAVWKLKTYTVTYDKGPSGSGTNTTATKTHNVALTLKGAIFTRTGYTQTSWYSTSPAQAFALGGSYTANADITLYPTWTRNTYQVSYNKGSNGSGTNTNDTKTYNEALTLKGAIFTRTGYTQTGWSTTDGGSKAYNLSGSYTANAAVTLYPFWTAITYTVSYNKGANGTGTNSTDTKTYNEALTLKGAQFTRTGYAQTGWATSDGGAQAYALSGSYTANAAVTLYPVWTATTSTVSTTNGTLGTEQTITITRHNSSFTHTLTYKYGNATGTIVTKTTSTSVSWTPETSLASQFPSANSGTCTITCETFSGNTSLGTGTTTCTLTIPDSIKPSISSFTASHYAANATVSDWATFTAGYSQANLSVSYTLNGGATLASIAFSGPGVSSSGTATSVRTSVLTTPNTNTWKVRVTDSRGRWVESSVSKTVYDYAAPVVSGIAVARSNSSGTTDNGGGTYLKATPSFGYSSVNGKNSIASATLKYTVQGSSTVLGSTACTNGTTYGPTGTMWAVELTKAYNVTVTVTDALSNTSTYTTTLPSASGLWYGRGNDRLGLGGVPTVPGLHVDWNAEFNGVVDVTPRRCYASLSSQGWYRAIKFSAINAYDLRGADGSIIDIYLSRIYNYTDNEAHKISLLRTNNNNKFVSENSVSNSLGIDGIRLTVHDGGTDDRYAYIDIHYSLTTENPVAVHFNVYSTKFPSGNDYTDKWSAESLQYVGPSPSGETELTRYAFAVNTAGAATLTALVSRGTITSGEAVYVGRMIHLNFVFTASATATNSPWIVSAPNALYDTALSAIDITSGIGSAITAAIPCCVSTLGRIYLQSITSGHIYAITGDYLV